MTKVRILFLASNPFEQTRLALDEEVRAITAQIRSADYREAFELISGWAVRPDDLQHLLLQYKPHVVHFSGHGTRDGRDEPVPPNTVAPSRDMTISGVGRRELFVLLGDGGQPQPVSMAALVDLFHVLRDNVQLVLFNACHSESIAAAVAGVIPCTIGMNGVITDAAAILFAATFYRALGFGRNIREAFDLSKNALMNLQGQEDRTPRLYSRRDAADPAEVVLVESPDLGPPAHPTWKVGLYLSGDVATLNRKTWRVASLYPLQPAPNFAGRQELLCRIREWVTNAADPNRILALVAAGGTGKTALAERVLTELPHDNPFGVLVWSFFENPRTEGFLRAACEYFLGEVPNETGGLLEKLQYGLRRDGLPHLLILDGLECVQATGVTGRPRGELEDPLLKRLLRWLAAGHGTRSKALITSRFPLLDLADWTGHGFRAIDLSDLDALAARSVLRTWAVKGTNGALDALAESVHRHALTVDVLGSYLATFHAGDPSRAPAFDPQVLADTDAKTARLQEVLTSYAEKLSAKERDLLSRLSLFPRGVDADVIDFVIAAGGPVAGTLAGCGQVEVLKLLERLRRLGLIFRYDAAGTAGVALFTAHPFLRGFFAKLHGVSDPRQIHEAIRARLAAGVEDRPGEELTEPTQRDRYERLIEATALAGRVDDAFELYFRVFGHYSHLADQIGDNVRGLRLVRMFSTDGTVAGIDPSLSRPWQCEVLTDWGLFAKNLGDCVEARTAFSLISTISPDSPYNFINLCNIANLDLLAGRYPAALATAERIVRSFDRDQDGLSLLASALASLGNVKEAAARFEAASKLASGQYYGWNVWYPEFLISIGDKEVAARCLRDGMRRFKVTANMRRYTQFCTVMARLLVSSDLESSRAHLESARCFASRSGDIQTTLRCYHLAAEIARYEHNYGVAESEAIDGIHAADSCGSGRWALDIRTELAKIHLAAGNVQAAVEPAEWVLKRSLEADCQYAWGVADSLHLLGVASARLGNIAEARNRLSLAREKRKLLDHCGLAETEAELSRL
jgi:tetratricopeptide (TPR) repeat protein